MSCRWPALRAVAAGARGVGAACRSTDALWQSVRRQPVDAPPGPDMVGPGVACASRTSCLRAARPGRNARGVAAAGSCARGRRGRRMPLECASVAPVAQPDRVVASEAIGRGFESLRARHPVLLPASSAPSFRRSRARQTDPLTPQRACQRHGYRMRMPALVFPISALGPAHSAACCAAEVGIGDPCPRVGRMAQIRARA